MVSVPSGVADLEVHVDLRTLALPASTFTAGAAGGAVALAFFSAPELVAVAPVLCWLTYPIVGAVVRDSRPDSALGRLLCLLGVTPLLVAVFAVLLAHGGPTPEAAAIATQSLAGPQAAALLVGVPVLALPGLPRPKLVVALAGAGACLCVSGALGGFNGLPAIPGLMVDTGWLLIGGAVVLVLALLLRATGAAERQVSRRAGWLVVLVISGSVTLAAVMQPGGAWLGAYALAALPIAAASIHLAPGFPPPGEVTLNVLVACAWAGVVACSLIASWWGAESAGLPDPASAGIAMAAVVAVGLVPVLLIIRREALVHHYGTAWAPTRMMSALTAQLRRTEEPEDLLGVAAQAAADAVNSPSAAIALGPDEPVAAPASAILPLVVGGERVGSLVIAPRRPGRPLERRELLQLERLALPVALVARAVALAAQVNDVRSAERRRLLADLHDGLGPLLAGLSMQLAAIGRKAEDDPTRAAELAAASQGLAEARAEVRRIVDGLAPGRLRAGDLCQALTELVAGFRSDTGPAVSLHVAPSLTKVPQSVSTTAYRTVAEGLTNVVRHAQADHCDVVLQDAVDHVVVMITDDGTGPPLGGRPGIGLRSLRDRADSLGGQLVLSQRPGGGTTLRAILPKGST